MASKTETPDAVRYSFRAPAWLGNRIDRAARKLKVDPSEYLRIAANASTATDLKVKPKVLRDYRLKENRGKKK